MKSTPNEACKIYTYIEPLSIKRDTIEKMKRQEENNTNKKIFENCRHTERIKKKSVLSLANRLAEKYNMPDERETVLLFDVNNSPAKI